MYAHLGRSISRHTASHVVGSGSRMTTSGCEEKFSTSVCFSRPSLLMPMSTTAHLNCGAMVGATAQGVGDRHRAEKSASRSALASAMVSAAWLPPVSGTATTILGHCFPDQSHQRSRRIGM